MKRLRCGFPVIASLCLICFLFANMVWANPKDGKVVSGSAHFNTQGNTLTITNSPNSIINWKSFSIDANETTRFIQQNSSSSVLNRINGQTPSIILGSLQSNGKVLLINPNGILFGQGSRIDVNGLIASTLNISNQDFLKGNYNFNAGDMTGKIKNQGTITTPSGGFVYLIAPDIENSGIITSPNGEVILAAGHSVQLFDSLDTNISVVVSAPEDKAVNLGQIVAESGKVGIYGGLISQKGTVSADSAVAGENGQIYFKAIKDITLDAGGSISAQGGDIRILGGMEDGTIRVAGTIDASAPNGGDGGFIETSAANVKIDDSAYITSLAPYGKTGTWLIDPTNFTITSGSDTQTESGIGASTLQTALGTSDVTIATSAAGTEAGDINVNADVTWSTNNLSLQAHGDININAVMTANNAGLDLRAGYSTPGTDGGTYNGTNSVKAGFNPDGTFKGQVDFFQADGTTPRSGTGFLSINGIAYTVITSLGAAGDQTTGPATLQGMAAAGNLSGNYALGTDIDANGTSGWNGVSGFVPVGAPATPFTGTFDGLGHTITDLYINRTGINYVSLFGYADIPAVIKNTGMVNVNIAGYAYVGGLVGRNRGTITNSYSTGAVAGFGQVGGLVGNNYSLSTITNSYSTSTVTFSGTGINPGYFGGLVGWNLGSINNSYSTGTVSGGAAYYVGGLVGHNYSFSYITNSYSTGNVTGAWGIGGLLGGNQGSVANSYSTSAVTGTGDIVGGLAGENRGTISDSYSTGAVNGVDYVGGLVGSNDGSGSITNTYSTGMVTASGSSVGDFAGENYGTINGSFWDTTTSFIAAGVGYNDAAATADVTGLTTAQMMTMQPFFDAGWDIANTGGSAAVWRIYEDHTYPLLNSFLTPLTMTADDVTKVYDGTSAGLTNVVYSDPAAPGSGNLFGVATPYGSTVTKNNVGYYEPDIWSNQQGYDIVLGTGPGTYGTLTVTPAALTITGATAANKIYDGTTAATISGATLSGTIGGDTVTLGDDTSGAFTDKNVGTAKSVSTAMILSGADSGNYTLTQPALMANITVASLTLSTSDVTKVYDGGLAAAGTAIMTGGTLFAGDTLSGGTFAFTDKNAGTGKTVTAGGVIVNDGNGGNNYSISYVNNTGSMINPASLTVTANNYSKTYNGLAYSSGNGVTYSGFVGGENSSVLGGALAYNGTSQGAVNTGSYVITPLGLTSGNYTISFVDGVLTVTPASLTIMAVTNTKTYDGNTGAVALPIITSGVLFGSDTAVLSEVYTNKNAGMNKTLTPTAVISDGNGGNNYNVTYMIDTTGVINQAPLTITAATNTKTYDGTTSAVALPTITSGSLFGSDAAGLTEVYNDENAGTGKTLIPSAVVSDGNGGGNYNIIYINNTTGVINQAPLTITANDYSKTYNGLAYSGGNGVTYSGLVNGETSSVLGGALAYGGTSQGAVDIGSYVITPGGLTSGNYAISFLDGTLTINSAEQAYFYQNPVYVTMLNDQGIGKSTTIFEFSDNGLDNGSDDEQACPYCDEMFPSLY